MRLSAVGDVVRTLPAVSCLRSAYPGAFLAWLVEPRAASAVVGQPWVDEVIVFPRPALADLRRPSHRRAALRDLRRFARELRSRHFDLVLDFHSLLRSALLCRLSGAPRRVGYARPFGRELSWLLATDRVRLATARLSRFERNDALVRYLGISAPAAADPLRVPPRALARARGALGPGLAPVVIHPGTSEATPHKRWTPESYARVAEALAADGVTSLVSWGPARGDREAAEAVVAAAGGAARLAPPTPEIADLAALLAVARLYVGADTGPMHVASLVGTPVVQILGPTDPVENAPFPGTPSRTVAAAPGAGMDVAPEAVVAAARELLGAGLAASRSELAGELAP